MKKITIALSFCLIITGCSQAPVVGNNFGLVDDSTFVELSVSAPMADLSATSIQFTVLLKYSSGATKDVTAFSTFTLSDSSLMKINASGFITPLSIGALTVRASYQGYTSNEVAFAIVDQTDPLIFSAKTQDLDANGVLDAIKITFSEPVSDASVNIASWDVVINEGETFDPTANGDVPDNDVIYIRINEKANNHTAYTPVLKVGISPIKDLNNNGLSNANLNPDSTYVTTDGAAPVMTKIIATEGNNFLSFNFSEPVYGSSVSTDCTINPINSFAFSYQDNNAAGAGAITAVTGCGQRYLQTTLDANAVAGDTSDFVSGVSGKIFDIMGNEMVAFNTAMNITSNGGYFRKYFLTTSSGEGSQSFQLISGAYAGNRLIIPNGVSKSTMYFDESISSFIDGPSTGQNMLLGIPAFYISTGLQAGKWLVPDGGNGVVTTRFYNEGTDLFENGPSLSSGANSIGCRFQVTSGPQLGKWLLINGAGSSWYDPATGTISAGPAMPWTTSNCFAFQITSGAQAGNWLIIQGNNTKNTVYYNEGSDALVIGPVLSANSGKGVHAFQMSQGANAGKWLIVPGNNSNATTLLDESNIPDPLPAGPPLLTAFGGGGSSFTILSGANTGKRFFIHGNNSTATSLLDEATLAFTAGPSLSKAAAPGTHVMRIGSGLYTNHWMIIHGGWFSVDYYSEAGNTILPPYTNFVNAIGTGSSFQYLDAGINAGNWMIFDGGGSTGTSFYNESTGEVTVGPSLPLGIQQGANTFKILSGSNAGKIFIVRGWLATGTYLYDPMTGNFATGPLLTSAASNGAFSFRVNSGPKSGQWLISPGYNSVSTMWYDEANPPAAGAALTAGPDLPASVASLGGAQAINYASGKWLILHGGRIPGNTPATFYDEASDTFTAGPVIADQVRCGAYAVITSGVNAGKVLIVNGYNSDRTYWFDPAGTFAAGPVLTGTAANDAYVIAITIGVHTGKILIVHANGDYSTSLYDPLSDTMSAGPSMTNIPGNGAKAFTLQSGPRQGWLFNLAGGARVWSYYVP